MIYYILEFQEHLFFKTSLDGCFCRKTRKFTEWNVLTGIFMK